MRHPILVLSAVLLLTKGILIVSPPHRRYEIGRLRSQLSIERASYSSSVERTVSIVSEERDEYFTFAQLLFFRTRGVHPDSIDRDTATWAIRWFRV